MRQNITESYRFDESCDMHVLYGRKAILDCELVLQRLAERCDQLGSMNWLNYFLGGSGSRWKRPCCVLFLGPGADVESLHADDVHAAALFYELRPFGFPTGAYCTDDWEGLRTVVAPAALRGQAAACAINRLIKKQGAHVVLATYSCTDEQEKEPASMMLPEREILWVEYDRKVTKQCLTLEATYEKTLAKFGKQTRFNLRYYRKRLLGKMDCTFLADARGLVSEEDALRMNARSLNPVPEKECMRRYAATPRA